MKVVAYWTKKNYTIKLKKKQKNW